MKKILILCLLTPFVYMAAAQKVKVADTILVGSIEKNCPGGFEAFNMYLEKAAYPPAEAAENHKVGTVYVSFIIEPDGTVSNVCTILKAGYGMDEEAVRVIKQSANWTPAVIGDKPVRCFCRAAVQFFADFDKGERWVRARRID